MRGGEVDLATRQLPVYGWAGESGKDRKRCVERWVSHMSMESMEFEYDHTDSLRNEYGSLVDFAIVTCRCRDSRDSILQDL
eukprot:8641347-Alexandrium_andersonii.AAC.1